MNTNLVLMLCLIFLTSCGHMVGAALRPSNECEGDLNQSVLLGYKKNIRIIESKRGCRLIKSFFCSDYVDYSNDRWKGRNFLISREHTLELASRLGGNAVLILKEDLSTKPGSVLKSGKSRKDLIYTVKGEIYSCIK